MSIKEAKQMVWKLLQDGKTLMYESETLGIPRSTITSFKKRVEQENIPRRGRKSTVLTRDYWKLERLVKTHRRENLKDITKSFNENRVCLNGLFSCIYTKAYLLDGYQRRNLSLKRLIGKKVSLVL